MPACCRMRTELPLVGTLLHLPRLTASSLSILRLLLNFRMLRSDVQCSCIATYQCVQTRGCIRLRSPLAAGCKQHGPSRVYVDARYVAASCRRFLCILKPRLPVDQSNDDFWDADLDSGKQHAPAAAVVASGSFRAIAVDAEDSAVWQQGAPDESASAEQVFLYLQVSLLLSMPLPLP